MTKWEAFKTLIKSYFYLIGYVEDQWILWHYFKQKMGRSVQEYTREFIKMALMLGISPKNPYVLLKYLGVFHCDLHEKTMFFKPKMVDEAVVQAEYLENIGLERV